MNRIIAVFLFIFCTTLSPAFADDIDISGFYKNVMMHTRSAYTEESISVNINMLRVKLEKKSDPWLFFIMFDNEAMFHDFGNTKDFDAVTSGLQNKTANVDLDIVSSQTSHEFVRHAIYRAVVKYYNDDIQVSVGKQAIDWGKMRFYSPIDLFNTLGPLDYERDKKVGADAININFSPGSFYGLNIVAAPGENQDKTSYAIKAYKTIKTYDISFVAAKIKQDKTFGIAFDGYLGAAGFRGEITHNVFNDDREFARLTLGLDYNFTDKIYVLFEQFYNGGADDNDTEALLDFSAAKRILSLKKNLSNLMFTYKATPLIDVDNYLIFDWDEKSIVVNPEVKYNVKQNMDVSVGCQLFWGSQSSEFGGYENTYYGKLKWYF